MLAAPVGVAGQHVPLGAGFAVARRFLAGVAGVEGERTAVTAAGDAAAVHAHRDAEAGIVVAAGGALVRNAEALAEFLRPQGYVTVLPRIHAQLALTVADDAGRLIGERDRNRARRARHVRREAGIDLLIELLALRIRQRLVAQGCARVDDGRAECVVIRQR
jgi:hypothetical protein